jgi:hypothetical protein
VKAFGKPELLQLPDAPFDDGFVEARCCGNLGGRGPILPTDLVKSGSSPRMVPIEARQPAHQFCETGRIKVSIFSQSFPRIVLQATKGDTVERSFATRRYASQKRIPACKPGSHGILSRKVFRPHRVHGFDQQHTDGRSQPAVRPHRRPPPVPEGTRDCPICDQFQDGGFEQHRRILPMRTSLFK